MKNFRKQLPSAILVATMVSGSVPVYANNTAAENKKKLAGTEKTVEQTAVNAESEQVPMYRVYNPNSGEHFYTASAGEKKHLVKLGWHDEGTGWTAPKTSKKPVYRLYNKHGGEHHYTLSKGEQKQLVSVGWTDEGIGWYSDEKETVPVYRQYNPNSFANNHNYTTSVGEKNHLISLGWHDEKIGWYGIEVGNNSNDKGTTPEVTPKLTSIPTPTPSPTTTPETKENEFTVTFNSNGGSNAASQVVKSGEQVKEPEKPSKEGFVFAGWCTDEALANPYDFSSAITSNLTLYAKWVTADDNLGDDKIDLGDIEDLVSKGKVEVLRDDYGNVISVDGKFTDRKVTTKEEAAEVLNSAAPLFGDGFSASASEIEVQKNSAGVEESSYRYTPIINEIPVVGSQIVLVTKKDGEVTSISNSYDARINSVDTEITISSDEAEEKALESLISEDETSMFLQSLVTEQKSYDDISDDFKNMVDIKADKVIFAKEDLPRLTYAVQLYCLLDNEEDDTDVLAVDKTYYIAANGNDVGNVICIIDNSQKSSETKAAIDWHDSEGKLHNVNVKEVEGDSSKFALIDDDRQIYTYKAKRTIVNNIFNAINHAVNWGIPGDLVIAPKLNFLQRVDEYALYVHTNMGSVYDYYHDVLSRNSYDGRGAAIKCSYLTSYNNACWSPNKQQMVFGKGNYQFAKALDVCGHEFTHAVINYEVGNGSDSLNFGEASALNESFADIIGMEMEGKTGKEKWKLGEDSGYVARDFSNPAVKNYSQYSKDADKHRNCQIFNYAVYKMMNDSRLSTIGRDTWSKIFYNTLHYLTTTATFLQARGAVICAAKSLGLDSNQQQAIKDAFDAVGIKESKAIRIVLNWGTTPSDLDSHLVGPKPQGDDRFEVYYVNRYLYNDEEDERSGYAVDLDYDDTTSYGPEITTIHTMTPGTYYFYVHDFSNGGNDESKEMSNSGAIVRVYLGDNSTPKVYTIDKEKVGTDWNVFKLTIDKGGNKSIETINTYENGSSYAIE